MSTRSATGDTGLWRHGASALVEALRRRDLTSVEVTEHFLARIDRIGPCVGAFAEVTAERSLDRARRLDRQRVDDDLPLLWGLPTADKDLTARAGVATRYGSRAFAHNIPAASDPLADTMDRAGAVSLGKTSTPEFGLVGYTEPEAGVPARNPWDLSTGAGGSSGGAAAAVAAGLLPAAPASDGGGSIRIPAATVGVVGVKPARGTVFSDRSGSDSLSLSVAGPIARSVRDAALLLDAMVGADSRFRLDLAEPVAPRRIAVMTASPWDDAFDIEIDPRAQAALDDAAVVLQQAGHDVVDLTWRPTGYADFFVVLWRLAAARVQVADERLDDLLEPRTAWLVRQGRSLTPQAIAHAYAQASEFAAETRRAFRPFDAVLTPALALSPRPIGWYDTTDPERDFAQQCQVAPHTSFVNVAGLPAVSVPMGAPAGERPWSVQLVGGAAGESVLLRLAAQLEAGRGELPWPSLALD